MRVNPFRCDCCPTESKDLILIETRFEAHRCFAELQCRVCHALWTAEIGPVGDESECLAAGVEDQGKWRVVALTPLVSN